MSASVKSAHGRLASLKFAPQRITPRKEVSGANFLPAKFIPLQSFSMKAVKNSSTSAVSYSSLCFLFSCSVRVASNSCAVIVSFFSIILPFWFSGFSFPFRYLIIQRFLDNVKRLIDRFQIYYRRMVQLRLHFRSVRKLESRRDEPAPEHLRDRCEFRIAKSASF